MRARILNDVVATAVEAWTTRPASFADEAPSIAWLDKLEHGLNVIGYDIVKSDTTDTGACKAALTTSYSDEEIEQAYTAYVSSLPEDHKLKAPVGKIGDGTILNFLKSVDWAKVISTVVTIISVLPKTPA